MAVNCFWTNLVRMVQECETLLPARVYVTYEKPAEFGTTPTLAAIGPDGSLLVEGPEQEPSNVVDADPVSGSFYMLVTQYAAPETLFKYDIDLNVEWSVSLEEVSGEPFTTTRDYFVMQVNYSGKPVYVVPSSSPSVAVFNEDGSLESHNDISSFIGNVNSQVRIASDNTLIIASRSKIIRVSSDGSVLLNTYFSSTDDVFNVDVDEDINVYMTIGQFGSGGETSKLDKQGNLLNTFNTQNARHVRHVDGSGNIFALNENTRTVTKYDVNGDFLWSKDFADGELPDSTAEREVFKVERDGYSYVIWADSTGSEDVFHITRLAPDGSEVWDRSDINGSSGMATFGGGG